MFSNRVCIYVCSFAFRCTYSFTNNVFLHSLSKFIDVSINAFVYLPIGLFVCITCHFLSLCNKLCAYHYIYSFSSPYIAIDILIFLAFNNLLIWLSIYIYILLSLHTHMSLTYQYNHSFVYQYIYAFTYQYIFHLLFSYIFHLPISKFLISLSTYHVFLY